MQPCVATTKAMFGHQTCPLTYAKVGVTRVYGLQVMVNEDVDPALVIKRLKQEIRDLKDEIRFASCPCLFVAFAVRPRAGLCCELPV